MKANRLVFTILLLLSAAVLRLAAQQPQATRTNAPGTNASLSSGAQTTNPSRSDTNVLSKSESADEGIAELKARAEKGDAEAQLKLGYRYAAGKGVAENKAEAVKWHRRAAEQGNAQAQNILGGCYLLGNGVERDEMEAVKWYRKAAEQNDVRAQKILGVFYETGGGSVQRDYAEAAKWYRKAAEQGDAEAQRKMGRACNLGQGVKIDYAEAIRWWRKAAEQGDGDAQLELGYGYKEGEEKLGSVTLNGGFKKDSAESAKWLKKAVESHRVAAEKGDLGAQKWLGLAYKSGDGVEKDLEESAKWYRMVAESHRKSAEQGDARAQYSLGLCYSTGDGVPKDSSEAIKWLRRAALQGESGAQFSLGLDYYYGASGLPQDFVQAYMWFNLSAAGDVRGDESLGARFRKKVAAEMLPAQIAEAQMLARDFEPRKESAQGSHPKNPFDQFDDATTVRASGTGFFLTEDGFLVTNEHVVKEAGQIRLVTSAGMVSAKVVKADAANDLALLKAGGRFAALPVASSRGVKLGGTVATVGFPNIGLQGFAPKLAKGEIASLSGAGDDARYFQISVPVQPGNSGGALVDERGNVVGVVSAKLSARAALAASGALPENVNYAVKSSFLLGFLESVPEVSAKLKEPDTKERKFEDVVKSAEQAAVLVLVY